MSDLRSLLERADRAVSDVPLPSSSGLERLHRRRDRKRRNQRLTAGLVGFAVFAAAVWLVTGVPFERAHEEPAIRPSPTPSANAYPERNDYLIDVDTRERTTLPVGIVGAAWEDLTTGYAVSPDGSKIAYVRFPPADSLGVAQDLEPVCCGQIWIANLDGTGAEQMTNDRSAEAPAWSPDGSKIAYSGRRDDDHSNVYVLDLATGTSTQLTSESGGAYAIGFSADGASIFYSAQDQIRIVPITGGEGVPLVDVDGTGVELGAVSSDGTLIAFACHTVDLCLANADGSSIGVVVEGDQPIVAPVWSPDGTRIAYSYFHGDVYVVDVATAQTTWVVQDGAVRPAWVDERTLIVEIERCLPGPLCAG